MVVMKEFMDLVRWRNLAIVIFTMVLMRYAIIEPLISKTGVVLKNGTGELVPMALQMPLINFILLVMATVFITAGGYVINDYFDIKTDLINRGRVIVGTKIPRRQAMLWHLVLNLAGILIGFYISWRAGYLMLGAFFLLVSGLLYFYSASYKRQFLIGNLIVALLTAMVPLLVVIYDWPALYKYYSVNSIRPPEINFIFYWVGGFAIFAFFTTLARELIKDIEDFEGDAAYGRNTVPVVTGILTARIISISLIALIIAMLYITWYFFINDLITLVYLSVAIVLPLLIVIFRLAGRNEKIQFHKASNLIKIVMLTGILYSVVVKIILNWNLV
jgi:4-hydroxybenzoate polyprenyltransferase